jgi:hypothetical protein
MNHQENSDDSLQPKDIPSTGIGPKQEMAELPEAGPEDANHSVPTAIEKPEFVEAIEQQADADGSPSLSEDHEPRTDEAASSVAVKSVPVKKPQSFFGERPLPAIEMAPRVLRYQSRRDFLVFGAGALAALAGAGFLLPQNTLTRLGVRRNMKSPAKEWFLNKALRIDDDVAEALYSVNRRVPTYTKSQITPLTTTLRPAGSMMPTTMPTLCRSLSIRSTRIWRISESGGKGGFGED